jgi:hypothetical protein
MIYGHIELRRTRGDTTTDLYWVIDRTDTVDREETKNKYEPNNPIFWSFPIDMTDEEVLEKMLAKMKEDIHWELHLLNLAKKAADRYIKKGITKEDFNRTEKYTKSINLFGTCKTCVSRVEDMYCEIYESLKPEDDWFCADYEKKE